MFSASGVTEEQSSCDADAPTEIVVCPATVPIAAVIVATQLGIDHWFYLYIPWFFPLVMLVLLGRFTYPRQRGAAVASESAQWSQPAMAASTG